MKRILAVMIALSMLTGCTGKRDELDRAMKLRVVDFGEDNEPVTFVPHAGGCQ